MNLCLELIDYLKSNEIEVEKVKLENTSTDDYPDFAYLVCKKVLEEECLGLLICGSGIGMSIAANKMDGIRCARVVNEDDAFLSKNHNGANVIAVSANTDLSTLKSIIDTYIVTKMPNEERHLRRIEKINKIEKGTYNEL